MTVTEWQKLHCMGESQRRRGNGRRPGLLLPPPRTSREALERPQASLLFPPLSGAGKERSLEGGEGELPGERRRPAAGEKEIVRSLLVQSVCVHCACVCLVQAWRSFLPRILILLRPFRIAVGRCGQKFPMNMVLPNVGKCNVRRIDTFSTCTREKYTLYSMHGNTF